MAIVFGQFAHFFVFLLWDRLVWLIFPLTAVLRVFSRQSILPQVSFDVVHPSPPRSSSSPAPVHLQRHRSSSHILLFSPHYVAVHFEIYPTFVVLLIVSFLVLSIFVTPHVHLSSILISVTCSFLSCAVFSAHVSAPYIIRQFAHESHQSFKYRIDGPEHCFQNDCRYNMHNGFTTRETELVQEVCEYSYSDPRVRIDQ